MISDFRRKLSRSKYVRDIFWQGSGNVIAQAVGILTIPILTRLYSPTDFGTLNLFAQVVAAMTIFLTWRYEYLLLLPKDEQHVAAIFRFLIIVGVIGTILLTALGYIYNGYVADLLGNRELAIWLYFAPLTALLTSVSVALQQRIQRLQDYRNSGMSDIIGKIGYAFSGLLGSLLLPNIVGLMLATATGMLGKGLWILRTLQRRRVLPEHSGSISFLTVIHKYKQLSGSMMLSHVMLVITGSLPALFIMKMYGSETLGQFSLVLATLYLPSGLVGNAIGQVYYERAAKRYANNESFDDLWRSTAKYLLIIGIPLYAAIAIVSRVAYPFVFGEEWAAAGYYATLLAVSAFFSFATSPLDKACLVVNAWRYIPIWHTARALTTALVVWLAFIKQWDFETFLVTLIVQMNIMYLIDYYAEWRFSVNGGARG